MHQHLEPHLLKAAIGGIFTLATWALGQTAQAIDVLPEIIKAADTPMIIAGMAYAIIHLWRSWQAERRARLDDIDKAFRRMETDSDRAAEGRERLIHATTVQTEEFKALRRSIEASRNMQHQPRE